MAGAASASASEHRQLTRLQVVSRAVRPDRHRNYRGIGRGIETSLLVFEENWAEFHDSQRKHPPVLFVVGYLPKSLGQPLVSTVRERHDERLIGLIEPVLTNPQLLAELRIATANAELLSPIAKQHFATAFEMLGAERFIDAYPPFYEALQAGFTAAARSRGVIDRRNHFLIDVPATKMKKTEDLLAHLPLRTRYRRFLRSWIFGETGDPFRHGDVEDPEECRRQALLLGMAAIGWLDAFGTWERRDFKLLLRSEASSRLELHVYSSRLTLRSARDPSAWRSTLTSTRGATPHGTRGTSPPGGRRSRRQESPTAVPMTCATVLFRC